MSATVGPSAGCAGDRRRRRNRRDERARRGARQRHHDQLIQHLVTVKLFTRTFPTSNVWVLRDGNEAVLIDAGFGDEASSQVRIDYLTGELSNLDFKYIAITHHHFDHSSGGRRLREACTPTSDAPDR